MENLNNIQGFLNLVPKDIRTKVCEGLVGHKRWSQIGEPKYIREDHYYVIGNKLKDIYPLIGGKHKKWVIMAFAKKPDGTIEER